MPDLNSIFEMKGLSGELNILALVTLLSLIPIIVISMTTFTRNLIVFSFVRHALGLQQSPPNIVIIVLSLIVMFFTMQPVFKKCYIEGVIPYQQKEITIEDAVHKTWEPMRTFISLQTQEKDIQFLYKISKKEIPKKIEDVEFQYLVPAFMLSELKLSFKIGFIIFLPFLLIDLVIAAILTSLGMIMVPPTTISLPLKIMLFVVIDGWELITQVLVTSVVT
jgi:flagellar biosynthetic protein FliP